MQALHTHARMHPYAPIHMRVRIQTHARHNTPTHARTDTPTYAGVDQHAGTYALAQTRTHSPM